MSELPYPGLAEIRAAQARIRPHVHRTTVITSRTLDGMCGARLFFKAEHLQKVGAFKARGACNAVLGLDEASAARGVATHSSGNHGAALAWAAGLRGIPAHVVVPENSNPAKRANIERYGARLVLCAPTLAAREETLARVVAETGAEAVPPYDDARVIAGQGTAVLELLEHVGELEIVVTPVGGGGLIAGSALAAHGIDPGIRVIGAEPLGADDAARSLATGSRQPLPDPRTIADGLRATLGVLNFALIQREVEAILTVTEEQIVSAMRLFWEITKQLIEPSSATVLAAVLAHRETFAGRRVGLVLSGGNVDLDALPWRKT
jgi:threonine dehydratase